MRKIIGKLFGKRETQKPAERVDAFDALQLAMLASLQAQNKQVLARIAEMNK